MMLLLALASISPVLAAQASRIYDINVETIDGKTIPLSTYEGKVMLIVNVASKCGFTPQYTELQQLYTQYKNKGLVILGFPCNNFAAQEPGKNHEIHAFCTSKYGVTFPMFAKLDVIGASQHALYRYLIDKRTNPNFSGEISWNFNKFLVNRKGVIINRFDSFTTPTSPTVIKAIQDAL